MASRYPTTVDEGKRLEPPPLMDGPSMDNMKFTLVEVKLPPPSKQKTSVKR